MSFGIMRDASLGNTEKEQLDLDHSTLSVGTSTCTRVQIAPLLVGVRPIICQQDVSTNSEEVMTIQ